MEKPDHEYWYYFGRCTPRPVRIKKGETPTYPYKIFKTKEDCQKYIDSLKL